MLRIVCRAGFCRPRHAVSSLNRAARSLSVPDPRQGLGSALVVTLVARDGGVVGGERGREFVAAVAAGDEVKVVDGGGVDGRPEGVLAGVRDRRGREAADGVGVV